jgi:DNA-binding XRE family transcriptional regulator
MKAASSKRDRSRRAPALNRRRGRPKPDPRRATPRPGSAGAPAPPDYPYILALPDGRRVLVEVPGKWVTADRDGSPAFLPPAVAYLDRVLVLAMSSDARPPTPGCLATLRRALGMTQAQFGVAIGRDKITVSRWERGETQPSADALRAIDAVRRAAVRKGVVLPS